MRTTQSPTATGWRGPGLTAAWTQWRKRYPDLDVEAVAVHGSTLNYFAKEAGSIKLLVIGHERARRDPGVGRPARLCDAAPGRLFCVGLPNRRTYCELYVRHVRTTERASHGESLSRR